ncbi:MAG: serpin family protein [Bradyrhizobiaceae bacterium]|nr:serpin family protein [Bradyrhizobiaceae bacterium]
MITSVIRAIFLGATVMTALMAIPTQPALAEAPAKGGATEAASDLVAAAQARLAFSLIEKIGSGAGQQATISPASLAAAFDLVSIGADPALKAAIAKVLGFPHDRADSGLAALAGIRAKLAAGGDAFTFADRIVFSPSNPPTEALLASLAKSNVPFETVDLTTSEGAKKIDDWVKEVTNGKIPELLGGPVPNAAFAALNALHFKSRWKTPFDPHATQPASFTGLDGKKAEVAMMRLDKGTRAFRQEKFGERDNERNFVAIDLPFADERFSLVVVTTTGKPATAREFSPVGGWLSGGDRFKPHSGDLALPRFSAAAGQDLLKILDGLGLAKARKSPQALAGFGPGIDLSQVIQRTVIEVTEEGAEAAAATAVIGTRMLLSDDSIHMVVDKPFIYALRDKTTGLILIAGYAGQPPKGIS